MSTFSLQAEVCLLEPLSEDLKIDDSALRRKAIIGLGKIEADRNPLKLLMQKERLAFLSDSWTRSFRRYVIGSILETQRQKRKRALVVAKAWQDGNRGYLMNIFAAVLGIGTLAFMQWSSASAMYQLLLANAESRLFMLCAIGAALLGLLLISMFVVQVYFVYQLGVRLVCVYRLRQMFMRLAIRQVAGRPLVRKNWWGLLPANSDYLISRVGTLYECVHVTWKRFAIGSFDENLVPEGVVAAATRIKQSCPASTLEVSALVSKEALVSKLRDREQNYFTCFLIATLDDVSFVLAAWNNNHIEQKILLPALS